MTLNNFLLNAGNSIIVRLKIDRRSQTLANIISKIAKLNGILGAITIVRSISETESIKDYGDGKKKRKKKFLNFRTDTLWH